VVFTVTRVLAGPVTGFEARIVELDQLETVAFAPLTLTKPAVAPKLLPWILISLLPQPCTNVMAGLAACAVPETEKPRLKVARAITKLAVVFIVVVPFNVVFLSADPEHLPACILISGNRRVNFVILQLSFFSETVVNGRQF